MRVQSVIFLGSKLKIYDKRKIDKRHIEREYCENRYYQNKFTSKFKLESGESKSKEEKTLLRVIRIVHGFRVENYLRPTSPDQER